MWYLTESFEENSFRRKLDLFKKPQAFSLDETVRVPCGLLQVPKPRRFPGVMLVLNEPFGCGLRPAMNWHLHFHLSQQLLNPSSIMEAADYGRHCVEMWRKDETWQMCS
jgi:hypothetical protein